MYDFYFGEKNDVLQNELEFLVSIKRMMPRWVNSIPDSEFIALYDDLNNSNIVKSDSTGVIVETGCGASTIILAYFAFKYNKKLYTWDLNQNKISYVKQIIVDTIEKLFNKTVYDHWIYVGYLSNSKELGIDILGEKGETIDFGFFDSEHTADTLLSEINIAMKYINDGAVFALDDANYNYKYQNTSYINIFRKKLALPPVVSPEENLTKKFFELAENAIFEKFPKSTKLDDSYKKNYQGDIFFQYFANDKNIMNNLGMEKLQELEHRYDVFKILK
jgi:hypothetical protein